MALTDRQAVELFQLHALRILATGPDLKRLALKGGCNLRFFFGSERYSEDMDLDTFGISRHVLKAKVDRILAGGQLRLALRSRGIEVLTVSAPKQTETTQRWKLELSVETQTLPLRTKLEFSHRRTEEQSQLEAVSRNLLAEYQLMPLLAPHYAQAEAIRQKIRALIGRTAVQARDVFDLATLFSKGGNTASMLTPVRSDLPNAIERAMEISYPEFNSQVVAYLAPSAQEEYRNRAAWDGLQTFVVASLQAGLR
ncbi:MAG: nucleotidyl transferase AbiEii/AbiGii toxin family protein [Myxococcaceae bacterium]